MNKILSIAAIIAISTTGLFAKQGDMLSVSQLSKIKTAYPKIFEDKNINLIKGIDQGDFTQLQLSASAGGNTQKFDMYVSKKVKNAVFFGKAFSKDKVPYTFPVNNASVKSGVAFTVGTGPEQLYLITDPECPYCQKLEQNINPDAYKRYTVNIISHTIFNHFWNK